MSSTTDSDDMQRITGCLLSVADFIRESDPRALSVSFSRGEDPTTSLDRDINRFIFEKLPRAGEGWLSEDEDDLHRLCASRVWVVDPIDGTREFVDGCPEWCVSIGLVKNNEAVAGGVLNPSTGEMFWGSKETGLRTSGSVNTRGDGNDRTGVPRLLVSRREHKQGKWKAFDRPDVAVVPLGSIAYRLARVAAGLADATCTFETRHEWDVAGGVALLLSAGGRAVGPDGAPIRFNQETPKLQSLFAFSGSCSPLLPELCGLYEDTSTMRLTV
jgi:myo-inositol-1(or 4)-monophosphatase